LPIWSGEFKSQQGIPQGTDDGVFYRPRCCIGVTHLHTHAGDANLRQQRYGELACGQQAQEEQAPGWLVAGLLGGVGGWLGL